MPNNVAIVTDSTAYLPEEYLQQYNISVAPLSVIWDDHVYQDGIDILPGEFYKRLAESKITPTTSQVMPAVMQLIFESLLLQSCDVLGIFLSSKISGTVQSAIQARGMLRTQAKTCLNVKRSRKMRVRMRALCLWLRHMLDVVAEQLKGDPYPYCGHPCQQ